MSDDPLPKITVDLEIFVCNNFCMINFRVTNIIIGTTPYRVGINSAH